MVLLLAAAARTWGTFEIATHIEDEPNQVPTAMSLGTFGTATHSNWAHPPLSGLLIFGSISLLGDNPRGWRSVNVLLGTATVLLLFLAGLRLYPGTSAPLLAAALLAFDPFHVFQSRTTFMEVPVTFFFLAFLYAMLEYAERGRPALLWAGLAAGLTMATKDYFAPAILLTAGYAWWQARRRGEARGSLAVDFLAALVLLPLAVYLLCYLPWFGRGYSLLEFVQMKADAFRSMNAYRVEELVNRAWAEAGGRPWEWFLKPFLLGSELPAGSGEVRYLLEINNFPFRLVALLALPLAAIAAWRARSPREALVPVLFAAGYLVFLSVGRPIFSYSATVLLPFAYLAAARAVDLLSQRTARPTLVRGAFLAAVVLSGAYLFPLAAGRPVPRALNQPLLPLIHLVGRT
jgi:predicted membrane-bound dolichyl-phosphate-mannose-protein mannosyltransferase